MTENKKMTLGELELRDLVDLGLRMPDGSRELFEVVNITDDCVTVMTKNIVDLMPFNRRENKHSGLANSYTKSTVRLYLKELYQRTVKNNKQLLDYTLGVKEFFLPSVSLFGIGVSSDWQAFKDDSSRIKYLSKYSTQKLGSSNFLEEPSGYWLNTPDIALGDVTSIIIADGSIDQVCVDDETIGITPVLYLDPSASLTIHNGAWCLAEDKTNTEHSNTNIKIGDWIEVTHTVGADVQNGILLGDCFEVAGVNVRGKLIVKLPSAEIWYLLPDQVRKIEPPLPHYKKSKETAEFSERLKGYYQHTAIEALKVYHTAHKAKEERTKALNKVVENIQELIKLENE